MLFRREPVLIASLVRAVIVLGTAFGLELDAAQIGALILFAEAVLGVIVRSAVTSPATAGTAASVPSVPAVGLRTTPERSYGT